MEQKAPDIINVIIVYQAINAQITVGYLLIGENKINPFGSPLENLNIFHGNCGASKNLVFSKPRLSM